MKKISQKACKRYQHFSEEGKNKKWQYRHGRYKNLSENER